MVMMMVEITAPSRDLYGSSSKTLMLCPAPTPCALYPQAPPMPQAAAVTGGGSTPQVPWTVSRMPIPPSTAEPMTGLMVLPSWIQTPAHWAQGELSVWMLWRSPRWPGPNSRLPTRPISTWVLISLPSMSLSCGCRSGPLATVSIRPTTTMPTFKSATSPEQSVKKT